MFQHYKASGMTTAETMESLASSDFFAGVPHVDWKDSIDVPPDSLNAIGTMVPMADSALSYADPYGAPQAVTQLQDDPCNDIKSELHPSPKSGVKLSSLCPT